MHCAYCRTRIDSDHVPATNMEMYNYRHHRNSLQKLLFFGHSTVYFRAHSCTCGCLFPHTPAYVRACSHTLLLTHTPTHSCSRVHPHTPAHAYTHTLLLGCTPTHSYSRAHLHTCWCTHINRRITTAEIMTIRIDIGMFFSFMELLSLDCYHFYYLMIMKEMLTCLPLSNLVSQ